MEMEVGGLEEEMKGVTIDPCANYPNGSSMNGGNADREASPSPSTLELAEKLTEAMDEAEMEDMQKGAASMSIDEQPAADMSDGESLAVDEGVAGLIEQAYENCIGRDEGAQRENYGDDGILYTWIEDFGFGFSTKRSHSPSTPILGNACSWGPMRRSSLASFVPKQIFLDWAPYAQNLPSVASSTIAPKV
ncbi:MAG: hypothetical protein Q9181_008253 [Wetmoreana brouardii]